MPSFPPSPWRLAPGHAPVARLVCGLLVLLSAACDPDASSFETRTGTTRPQEDDRPIEPAGDDAGPEESSHPGDQHGKIDDDTQVPGDPDSAQDDEAGTDSPGNDPGGDGDGDRDGDGDGDTPSDCTPGGKGLIIEDDVVTDRATCLTWQRGEPTQPTYCEANDRNPMGYCWTAAALACEDLELHGASDFRLPSQAELLTIVDKTEFPTADKQAFPGVRQLFYWSSREANKDHAWCVDFGTGNPSPSAAKWGGQAYRCVRGPAIADKP